MKPGTGRDSSARSCPMIVPASLNDRARGPCPGSGSRAREVRSSLPHRSGPSRPHAPGDLTHVPPIETGRAARRSASLLVFPALLLHAQPPAPTVTTAPPPRADVKTEDAPKAKEAAKAATNPVERIKDEALHRSKAMDTLSYMTDVLGPRLTGSPELKRQRVDPRHPGEVGPGKCPSRGLGPVRPRLDAQAVLDPGDRSPVHPADRLPEGLRHRAQTARSAARSSTSTRGPTPTTPGTRAR